MTSPAAAASDSWEAFPAVIVPVGVNAGGSAASRSDVNIGEVIQMVIGIAKIPAADREQTERILRVALDGLRYRPAE